MESLVDAVGPPRWGLLRRIAFRFAAVYFLLYNLPFPIDAIPFPPSVTFAPVRMAIDEWVTKPWAEGWNAVVVWVGRQLFGLDITIRPNGSGDSTWNYVQVLCMAGIAAGVTVVWTGSSFCW